MLGFAVMLQYVSFPLSWMMRFNSPLIPLGTSPHSYFWQQCDVPTCVFHCGYGVLGIAGTTHLPPNMTSWIIAKESYFCVSDQNILIKTVLICLYACVHLCASRLAKQVCLGFRNGDDCVAAHCLLFCMSLLFLLLSTLFQWPLASLLLSLSLVWVKCCTSHLSGIIFLIITINTHRMNVQG